MRLQSMRTALRICCLAGSLALSAILAPVAAQSSTDTTGRLIVLVTAKGTGEPISVAKVSVGSPALIEFTRDSGVVTFSGVPAGPVDVLVRRSLYRPHRVNIEVHAGGVDTLRIEMVKPGDPE